MPFWIVLFICVVVAYFAVTEGAKKYFDMKLQVLFNLGLYQDCIDLLDRKLARIVMSTYKQYYLILFQLTYSQFHKHIFHHRWK